jgi:hypothetical protein
MPDLDRYFDEIDTARIRRARELSEIKRKFSTDRVPDPAGVNSKATVVLAYANWEGFYNECVGAYIRFLRDRGGKSSIRLVRDDLDVVDPLEHHHPPRSFRRPSFAAVETEQDTPCRTAWRIFLAPAQDSGNARSPSPPKASLDGPIIAQGGAVHFVRVGSSVEEATRDAAPWPVDFAVARTSLSREEAHMLLSITPASRCAVSWRRG